MQPEQYSNNNMTPGYQAYLESMGYFNNQPYIIINKPLNSYDYYSSSKPVGTFKTLLKALGLGFFIAVGVFVVMNFQVIWEQIKDKVNTIQGRDNIIVDSDYDGIPDSWEDQYGLNKNKINDAYEDWDNDNLTNVQEYKYRTNPKNEDTDGDGYKDGVEVKNGYSPSVAGEVKLDTDFDDMPDYWEILYKLNINNPSDAKEDPDKDGLVNLDEFKYKTNPFNTNTDNDGENDGNEVKLGLDPAIAGDARLSGIVAADSDADTMPDWWEDKYGLNKNDSADAKFDKDYDQLINSDEFFYGSNPNNPNTDGDREIDGIEVQKGYDPVSSGATRLKALDKDRDGVSDKEEVDLYGTNPNVADTDGDGIFDGIELDSGTDPTGQGEIKARLIINKIGVNAPLVWGQNSEEKVFQQYLRNGVAHYPGTAAPGREGELNGYVTGHSSYYANDPGKYKTIFRKLKDLKVGDTFYFEYYLQNGRKVILNYKIVETAEVKPEDSRLFAEDGGRNMLLVTCTPIPTALRRLYYKAEFQEPQ